MLYIDKFTVTVPSTFTVISHISWEPPSYFVNKTDSHRFKDCSSFTLSTVEKSWLVYMWHSSRLEKSNAVFSFLGLTFSIDAPLPETWYAHAPLVLASTNYEPLPSVQEWFIGIELCLNTLDGSWIHTIQLCVLE